MNFRTLLIAVPLFAPLWCFAQKKDFNGDWFIHFRDGKRQAYGATCAINLTKEADFYLLSYLPGTCTDHLPPEGKYTIGKNGSLNKGELEIRPVNGRLIYENDGYIQLTSFETDSLMKRIFRIGSYYIDSSDHNKARKGFFLRKSIKMMDSVLTLDEGCVECYYNNCISWEKLGYIDSSFVQYEKVLSLDSNYAEVKTMPGVYSDFYIHQAWEKYGKFKKYKEAILACKKAIMYDSTYADAWYNLGGSYFSNKQFIEAATAFWKCLELDPAHKKAKEGYDAALDEVGQKTD